MSLSGGSAGWGQEQAGPQAAAPQKHNTVRPAIKWKRFDYACENGAKVTVYLHDTTAKVRYQDHIYMMRQTRSADGNRYSDGKTVWWGKGDGGFLQEDTPDGDGKMIVKDCVLEKPATQDTVTGTITYLARMALPEQATIQVQLEDVSRADGAATVVAEEKFELGKRQVQVQVPFTLRFNPEKIDAKHRYSVSARVMIGSELKFVNDQAYPVLTQGNPANVDLILKPAKK
jgi:putative lipoprotein